MVPQSNVGLKVDTFKTQLSTPIVVILSQLQKSCDVAPPAGFSDLLGRICATPWGTASC